MEKIKHGIKRDISFEELKRTCNWILLLNCSIIREQRIKLNKQKYFSNKNDTLYV